MPLYFTAWENWGRGAGAAVVRTFSIWSDILVVLVVVIDKVGGDLGRRYLGSEIGI